MLHTLPRPGSGLQTLPVTGRDLAPVPDPAIFASAVARYRALAGLRGFRQSLYECLKARADALFELADAVLCADHAVTSLVQLCLEPEFTRGHGALYDALSAGRIDDERFFSLMASELPQAVDGPEALAWIAEHDVIDHGLLEKALAGLPPDDASQVRDACARWSRLRFAVELPVLRGTLVHVTVERLPDGRDPHRAMWLWHAGPGPPVPGRALARLPRTLRH